MSQGRNSKLGIEMSRKTEIVLSVQCIEELAKQIINKPNKRISLAQLVIEHCADIRKEFNHENKN